MGVSAETPIYVTTGDDHEKQYTRRYLLRTRCDITHDKFRGVGLAVAHRRSHHRVGEYHDDTKTHH